MFIEELPYPQVRVFFAPADPWLLRELDTRLLVVSLGLPGQSPQDLNAETLVFMRCGASASVLHYIASIMPLAVMLGMSRGPHTTALRPVTCPVSFALAALLYKTIPFPSVISQSPFPIFLHKVLSFNQDATGARCGRVSGLVCGPVSGRHDLQSC